MSPCRREEFADRRGGQIRSSTAAGRPPQPDFRTDAVLPVLEDSCVAPTRLVVLLAAAASLAGAGRLWSSAMTSGGDPLVAQLQPKRIMLGRPIVVAAAPIPPLVTAQRRVRRTVRVHERSRRHPVTPAPAAVSNTIAWHPHPVAHIAAQTEIHRARPVHPAEPKPKSKPKPKSRPKPAAPHPAPPAAQPAPTPPPVAQPAPAPVVTVAAAAAPDAPVAPASAPAAAPAQPPVTAAVTPAPTPAPEPLPSRPGNGWGDENHQHTGPPGHPGDNGP
jgi:hypothetical protein